MSFGSADNDIKSEVTATPVHLSEKQTEPIDGPGYDDNVLFLAGQSTQVPHLSDTSIYPKPLDVRLHSLVPESSTRSGINIRKEEVNPMPTTQLTEIKTMSDKENIGY